MKATCEKCWADSTLYPGEPRSSRRGYRERVKDHTCTPEQQAGPGAERCSKCCLHTLHQHAGVCMACGWDSGKVAIIRLEDAGHTPHCARRMVWGDGECGCGHTQPKPRPEPRPGPKP